MGGLSAVAWSRQNVKLVSTITCISWYVVITMYRYLQFLRLNKRPKVCLLCSGTLDIDLKGNIMQKECIFILNGSMQYARCKNFFPDYRVSYHLIIE